MLITRGDNEKKCKTRSQGVGKRSCDLLFWILGLPKYHENCGS